MTPASVARALQRASPELRIESTVTSSRATHPSTMGPWANIDVLHCTTDVVARGVDQGRIVAACRDWCTPRHEATRSNDPRPRVRGRDHGDGGPRPSCAAVR